MAKRRPISAGSCSRIGAACTDLRHSGFEEGSEHFPRISYGDFAAAAQALPTYVRLEGLDHSIANDVVIDAATAERMWTAVVPLPRVDR